MASTNKPITLLVLLSTACVFTIAANYQAKAENSKKEYVDCLLKWGSDAANEDSVHLVIESCAYKHLENESDIPFKSFDDSETRDEVEPGEEVQVPKEALENY